MTGTIMCTISVRLCRLVLASVSADVCVNVWICQWVTYRWAIHEHSVIHSTVSYVNMTYENQVKLFWPSLTCNSLNGNKYKEYLQIGERELFIFNFDLQNYFSSVSVLPVRNRTENNKRMLLEYFPANELYVSKMPVMYIISELNSGHDYKVNRNSILHGTASALYISNWTNV